MAFIRTFVLAFLLMVNATVPAMIRDWKPRIIDKLIDVLPSMPIKNAVHRRARYPCSIRYLRASKRLTKATDFTNLINGQLCLGASSTVLALGHWFEMIGVHTRSVPTDVVERHPRRDRAVTSFVHPTVSEVCYGTPIDAFLYFPVAIGLNKTIPNPARGRESTIRFNVQRVVSAAPVTRQEPHVMTLDIPASKVGTGDGSGLTTASAHTQSARVRVLFGRIDMHVWSLLNRFRGAMPREIAVSPGLFACLNYSTQEV